MGQKGIAFDGTPTSQHQVNILNQREVNSNEMKDTPKGLNHKRIMLNDTVQDSSQGYNKILDSI
jgi:hypothetical protein